MSGWLVYRRTAELITSTANIASRRGRERRRGRCPPPRRPARRGLLALGDLRAELVRQLCSLPRGRTISFELRALWSTGWSMRASGTGRSPGPFGIPEFDLLLTAAGAGAGFRHGRSGRPRPGSRSSGRSRRAPRAEGGRTPRSARAIPSSIACSTWRPGTSSRSTRWTR